MKTYELVDLSSGNLVGSYSSIREAYGVIRQGFRDHGVRAVAELGLFEVEGESQELVALGESLSNAALEAAAPHRRIA